MRFFSRHRVLLVLLGLGVIVVGLVGYRIKQQQAAAVPRRQLEVVVGVAKPVRKDLDVKLSYTADAPAAADSDDHAHHVVGLLPMALAFGVGTEANQPLAIAVIGGLLVSTFFTLVLIPTLYVMFEERLPRLMGGDDEEAGTPPSPSAELTAGTATPPAAPSRQAPPTH
jgi:hypothetical protein